MHVPHRRTPSPSMIVALAALVASLGGTAWATTKLVNGDKLIKKASLSGNRLRRGTLTGAQIKVSSLPKVPSAAKADAATNAISAATATHAATADSATHAAGADNATHATSADTASGLPALNWVPLQLANGWADGKAPDARTPAIAVDAQGIAHLRGSLFCTPSPCSPVVGQLPSGFAPSTDIVMAVDQAGLATGRLLLRASGQIEVGSDPDHANSSNGLTGLDGLSYALG